MTFLELRDQIIRLINSQAHILCAAEIHGVIASIEVETRNQVIVNLGKPLPGKEKTE